MFHQIQLVFQNAVTYSIHFGAPFWEYIFKKYKLIWLLANFLRVKIQHLEKKWLLKEIIIKMWPSHFINKGKILCTLNFCCGVFAYGDIYRHALQFNFFSKLSRIIWTLLCNMLNQVNNSAWVLSPPAALLKLIQGAFFLSSYSVYI